MHDHRYAVLGAAGFIGSHLVARLKSQGHWVRAVDFRGVPEREYLYGHADEIWLDRRMDLRSYNSLPAVVDGIDRIYHLAADHGGAGYFHSERDQPAARDNMQIDLNVLRACEHSHVERLFFASSFCAYPVAAQGRAIPLSEDMLFDGAPEQCYGAEKRFMTQLCGAARFDARCGVFATIYGPGQEAEGLRAKFPTAITRRAIEATKLGGKIDLWGDGSQIRTFLWIEDALDRIQVVMDAAHYDGPVNIASNEPVTVLNAARWACQYAGLSEPVFDFLLEKPTGVVARVPDNRKFHRVYPGAFRQTSTREGFKLLHESMVGG